MLKRCALAFVFLWLAIGGVAHFVTPDFFLKIVPPNLPLRMAAVHVSGFFELLGAAALLHRALRRAAGIGLFLLVIVVTPANVYMWQHAHLFPAIPQTLLALRLVLQVILLALIWWSTQADA